MRALCLAAISATGFYTLGFYTLPAGAQQPFPARAIRLIVPSLPGGGTDITARLLAPKMSEILGQQIVVENRAGAASIIGSELVARATPDGHTLLMAIATLTVNPHILRKIPFDVTKDFSPVSQAVVLPNVLVVHPSLPAKTVKDLLGFARAHCRKAMSKSACSATARSLLAIHPLNSPR